MGARGFSLAWAKVLTACASRACTRVHTSTEGACSCPCPDTRRDNLPVSVFSLRDLVVSLYRCASQHHDGLGFTNRLSHLQRREPRRDGTLFPAFTI